MKIYSISPTTNNRIMNTSYNRIAPISFKANGDETTDTVDFQRNIETKDNNSDNNGVLGKTFGFLREAFKPDGNQQVYSDSDLYSLMLLAGSKL